MDEIPAPLRYAAFTDDPAGGNPAGVVLGDRLPTLAVMRRIAREVGFSETAFVVPGDDDLLDTRYVSPEREVTFCGHATIATGVVLGERNPSLDGVRLPVATRERLAGMGYRYEELRALMLAQDWTTVAVVWREADDRWHARNPFPIGGVVEDPATGAAAAALGGWLRDAGLMAAPAELTVLQGHDMGRPSTIRVSIPADRPGIDVSGTAVPMP